MKKIIPLSILALALFVTLVLSACSQGPAATAGGSSNDVTAKQVGIKAQVNGDTVSIPAADVEKNINTRFVVNTANNKLSFMAYKYDNQVQVRADICPPCGSESFTLTKGTLVCDSCGTVFDAKTGAGIRGACVKYPKQPVAFQNTDGNLVMKGSDLTTAYQNTLRPK